MEVKDLIKKHEGFRSVVYQDSRGISTIGYGHNLRDDPIPVGLLEELFESDFSKALSQISGFEWFSSLDTNRQAVLIDMVFNMGIEGVLKFPAMIAALKTKDYATAAQEMLNSQWAKQVPTRAAEDAEIMRTGIL